MLITDKTKLYSAPIGTVILCLYSDQSHLLLKKVNSETWKHVCYVLREDADSYDDFWSTESLISTCSAEWIYDLGLFRQFV